MAMQCLMLRLGMFAEERGSLIGMHCTVRLGITEVQLHSGTHCGDGCGGAPASAGAAPLRTGCGVTTASCACVCMIQTHRREEITHTLAG